MDFSLPEELRLLKDNLRRYVDKEMIPYERETLVGEELKPEWREKFQKGAKDLGIWQMEVPEEFGGPGLGIMPRVIVWEELARSIALPTRGESMIGPSVRAILFALEGELREKYLMPVLRGEKRACFAQTEPDAGSDPGSMRTVARRDGDDWVINGSKMWITNGSIADVAIVWAATDEGIRGFLVEKDMPGFSAPPIHKKMSLRASITSELVFQDVRVPDENRLPEATSLRGPLSCLNEARYGIVWGVVGAARACYDEALSYATERIVFEKPLTSYQLTQQKLAEMVLEINRGMLMALHLGRMKDEGRLRPEHVSLGKMGNARGALDVARSARSILGGNGITLEYPVIRHMNNLESVVTYEGTHEVHTLVVGGAVTGIQAFR